MGRGAAICLTAGAFCLGSFFLFLAIGNPAPAPDPAPPVNEPQQSQTEQADLRQPPVLADRWDKLLQHSPLRHKMRRMWVDCALITGNGYDPEFADLEFLESAAHDIQRRAAQMATYWNNVRDGNRRAAVYARKRQWNLAGQASDEMHDACGDCHDETWPLQARGFVRGTFEAWAKQGTVWEEEPWGEQIFSSPPPVRKLMSGLREKMIAINQAIAGRNWKALSAASREMNEAADSLYQTWHEIDRQAGFIVEAAQEGDLTDVGGFYTAMTANCRICHVRYAEGRALDPLLWPNRRD